MRRIYETPSQYVPAGASANGAGALGIYARIAEADAQGARWSDVDATYDAIEAAVHVRRVDGDEVWGLHLG